MLEVLGAVVQPNKCAAFVPALDKMATEDVIKSVKVVEGGIPA